MPAPRAKAPGVVGAGKRLRPDGAHRSRSSSRAASAKLQPLTRFLRGSAEILCAGNQSGTGARTTVADPRCRRRHHTSELLSPRLQRSNPTGPSLRSLLPFVFISPRPSRITCTAPTAHQLRSTHSDKPSHPSLRSSRNFVHSHPLLHVTVIRRPLVLFTQPRSHLARTRHFELRLARVRGCASTSTTMVTDSHFT